MKIIVSQRVTLWEISVLSLALFLLFKAAVHADFKPMKGLAGPPFINSSHIQDMPEDWKKKPIKYDSAAAGADIAVALDGQLHHAWEPAIKKYAENNNLKIVVTHGTCGLSAGKLLRKSVDIGVFCCPPAVTDRLPGLRFHTLGIAAIVLIVHPDNPVDNITIEQARRIFMGGIYRWKDIIKGDSVKKTARLIQPVGRLHCKLRPGHWRLLLDNEDLLVPLFTKWGPFRI